MSVQDLRAGPTQITSMLSDCRSAEAARQAEEASHPLRARIAEVTDGNEYAIEALSRGIMERSEGLNTGSLLQRRPELGGSMPTAPEGFPGDSSGYSSSDCPLCRTAILDGQKTSVAYNGVARHSACVRYVQAAERSAEKKETNEYKK